MILLSFIAGRKWIGEGGICDGLGGDGEQQTWDKGHSESATILLSPPQKKAVADSTHMTFRSGWGAPIRMGHKSPVLPFHSVRWLMHWFI